MHESGEWKAFFDEAARLAEEVTELCILAIEVFKNAVAALFESEPDIAHSAMQTAEECTASARHIHHNAVGMLVRWTPIGDNLRRIVDLQRAASEGARISDYGKRLAEHARALGGTAEHELAAVHKQAPDLLVQLIRQVYVALRGCLVLTSTHDRVLAARLIAEDAQLKHLHQMLTATIERAIASQPQRAASLGHITQILWECRQIGLSVVAICEDCLNAPRIPRAQ